MKMAEAYGMRVERSHREQSLSIYKKNGEQLLHIQENGAPEVAWEHIWKMARYDMETFTGISIMDDWQCCTV